MELSKPAILTPPQNLMTARSVDDPFFANANHQLSDKGFLVASADSLIAWARTRLAYVDAVWARLLRH